MHHNDSGTYQRSYDLDLASNSLPRISSNGTKAIRVVLRRLHDSLDMRGSQPAVFGDNPPADESYDRHSSKNDSSLQREERVRYGEWETGVVVRT